MRNIVPDADHLAADHLAADHGGANHVVAPPAGRKVMGAGARAVIARQLSLAAHAIADLIVPPVCLSCGDALGSHNTLCGSCWCKVDFISAPLCNQTGLPLPYDTGGVMLSAQATAYPPVYDRARAVAQYSGVMRDLIHDFKYADQQQARVLFGRWLHSAALPLLPGIDLIIPVPLYRRRLLSRRFNQSALLAKEVARAAKLPFAPMALRRIRPTPSQVGKNQQERRLNVSGAFKVAASARQAIVNKNMLLIDDVITTGATVEACTWALKSAGAARVDVLALAMSTGRSLAIA